jgi:hypothetical protein
MIPVSKKQLAATFLAAAMALGPGAHAATIDISFGRDLFPVGSDRLTFDFDDGTNRKSATVNAGLFGGSAENGVGFDPKTLYRSANDVLFYCVDILNNLQKPVTVYNVNDVDANLVVDDDDNPRRDFGRMLGFLGAVNEVLGTEYGLVFGDKNWLNPNSGWMSGAIQVGIWESLYEQMGEGLDVDTGYFSVTDLNGKGKRLLDSVFYSMSTSASNALSGDQVRWFSNDKAQDLIADPVPVPAPLALLGAGLGLLAFGRRNSGRR